ncbi:TPR repeat-containing serine/threonine protein kinase (plasmid) [Nostoc sp. NIES-4103]|nr:TPR repeat-containing serine/threonine protein kinase [Nostoc sp. NIES-4103]
MIGKIIGGRYHIIYFLGGGGFGRAYLAKDNNFADDYWCVVKHLQPLLSPLSTMTWETAKRLFESEARVLRTLGEYDTIPKLIDYFEENQELYLVEEFIDGYELTEELENIFFDELQIYELLISILETLHFIQKNNVIHRDITPDNLIRRRKDNKLVLIDFGAVKQILIDNEGLPRRSHTIAIGKENYMPDEQANGRPGFYSDVYAVGVIVIQACIGAIPLKDDNGEFIWRNQADISPALANILDKMTSCYFKNRYQSALEVLNDINNFPNYLQAKSTNRKVKIFKFNYADIWYKRANELRNRKHHEAALLLYKIVIDIQEKHYKAWFNMGVTLSYLHLYNDAIQSYNQALKLKSKSSEAWFHKGILLYKLSSYEEALIAFNQAIQFHLHHATAWLYRGYILNLLGSEEEAIESFRAAIKLRPSYAAIFDNI